MSTAKRLTVALADLDEVLRGVQYPLPLTDAADMRRTLQALQNQLRDYLLPRAARIDAPLLAVVGGSTGAGKSTMVNSVLRAELTRPGVLRPTTRSPVLVCNPADEAWFSSDSILPGLVRTHIRNPDSRALQVMPFDGLPPGLGLLDAPDIDSVDDGNRRLADQLLRAADMWLFVTSAARYADLVGWEVLGAAAERNAVIAVVLNRCPPDAAEDLRTHLSEMLASRGVQAARLFTVEESELSDTGMVPDDHVAPIRQWLQQLAAESEARTDVAVQTLAGTVRSLDPTLRELADGARRQVVETDNLRLQAREEFRRAAEEISRASGDGTMLRGEVLSRWQDFVGTGEFMRNVEQRISRIRDRISGWFTGQKPVEEVEVAISDSLASLVVEHTQAACEAVVSRWNGTDWGRQITDAVAGLDRPSKTFPEDAARTIREWQSDILTLVSEQGRGKRMKARFLALGTNVVGAALIILTFASTGGLTTAEVGIAGGTSVLAQRLLEGVFGEDAVRRLAQRVKQDLDDRMEALLATELARYEQVCDQLGVDEEVAARLESTAAQLREASTQAFEDLTRPEGF